jgi:glycosyltransferase involved in cell wall biosynthesis
MKICLVSYDFPTFTTGGIGTQSYFLSLYLSKEGIDVSVLTAGSEESEIRINSHLTIVRLKLPINRSITKIPIFQYKVWLWLNNNRSSFDIIHFQENSGFTYYLSELLHKKKSHAAYTIEHFHHSAIAEYCFQLNSLFKTPKENIPYLFMPLEILQNFFCLKRAKSIITVSRCSQFALLSMGIDKRKISVIPNAIPFDSLKLGSQKNKPVDSIKFLYVGRLVPRKGADILIHAIALLTQKKITNFYVDIVGQGPLYNYLQKTIKKQDIKNCNLWGGISQNKLFELYDDADCFICPSRLEGFGIVLLEAIANGLPIIANDIPIFREIFTNEEIIFFKNNDAVDLANKLSDIIKNKIDLSFFRSNSYNKVLDNYTWEKIVDLYKKMYAQTQTI